MLEILEGDQVVLPKKYHETHNLCAVLYDQLAAIISDNKVYDKFKSTTFSYTEAYKKVEDMHNDKLFVLDWFVLNDMNKELVESLTQNLALALIKDIASFLYESLSNAKKGNLSVAYALLRKPFTDELLLLEQISIDKAEFVDRFYVKGDPELYDPMPRKIKINKVDIVNKSVAKLNVPLFENSKFIYDIRYNKECDYGINGITNQALHIVTSDSNYKTPDKSLNLVFLSSKKDLEQYWAHYYYMVPYLLSYTIEVVDEIIFKYLPGEMISKYSRLIKRHMASILWARNSAVSVSAHVDNIIGYVNEFLAYQCSTCNNNILFGYNELKSVIFNNVLLCDKCSTNQFTDIKFAEKFIEVWLSDIKSK